MLGILQKSDCSNDEESETEIEAMVNTAVNSTPIDESESSDSSNGDVNLPNFWYKQEHQDCRLMKREMDQHGSKFLHLLQLRAACMRTTFFNFILDPHHISQPALFLEVQSHNFEYSLTTRCCEISRMHH